MQQIAVSNRIFFYLSAFTVDCVNFMAILAEAFLAASVLGASEMQMGALGAANALGYALPCVWTGLLSERLGRRRMCLIAVAGLTLAYLITPQVGSIAALCGVSFCRSLATSFFWPPLMAWMAETSEQEALSGLLGGYNVFWTLGILTGFGVSGWAFEHLGPATPFYGAAALAVGMFGFLLVFKPRHGRFEAQENDVDPRKARQFVLEGYTINCLSYFLAALVLYLFPKVADESMGEMAQSFLHVSRMAGQLLIFLLLANTTFWHYGRGLLWFYTGIVAVGLVLIAMAQSYSLSLLGFALLGIGGGAGYMMSSYYALALIRTKGLGSGIQESLIGVGGLFGPLYGGVAARLSSPRASILAGLIPLAAVGGYLRWRRRRPRLPD